MNTEDWQLMQRVASGEEAAAVELYDRFGALVFKSARQVLSTRAEAEDAVQEVFVRLWRTSDRYDPARAKLVTWVMLIARRHLIDRLRRKKVRPTNLSLEGDPSSGKEGKSASRKRLLNGTKSSTGELQSFQLCKEKLLNVHISRDSHCEKYLSSWMHRWELSNPH
jgi:DNA-directed RNA polymerase specialized sigma24 family protein